MLLIAEAHHPEHNSTREIAVCSNAEHCLEFRITPLGILFRDFQGVILPKCGFQLKC